MPRLALRFISGKYKGGEYVLSETKETFVGRSSNIDLVLMEDMVSRKHARIWIEDDEVHIEDFGSTNGTFVNGEKINKSVVNKGDRILIGTSIMKLIESEKDSDRPSTEPLEFDGRNEAAMRTMAPSSNTSMSGTITEVPLPDLIQLFSTSKKTGTLVITRDDTMGKIHLEKGKLVFASMDKMPDLPPLKAIFHILSWNSGTFELRGPEGETFAETIDMPTEHILMEGLRHLDEIKHLENKLPPMDAEFVLVLPLMSRLADLSENDLDVLQTLVNCGTIRETLERCSLDPKEAAGSIEKLLKNSYIIEA
jgi:pSer/pThr/pTyr-binding forkhead associated (FHA) protein